MVKRRVPRRLWDYGIVWVCEIMSLTANSNFSLEGWTPLEQMTGETTDISEYLDFGFYDCVWYRDNAGVGNNKFGHWLGVLHRVGSRMSFWTLTKAGIVIAITNDSPAHYKSGIDYHRSETKNEGVQRAYQGIVEG